MKTCTRCGTQHESTRESRSFSQVLCDTCFALLRSLNPLNRTEAK
jgi:NMD protein affecting ribosome stability and mRNA decay